MIYKKDIINFLFVASFPIMGIGSFISGYVSPSFGSFVSVSPHILIILFYAVDVLYRKEFTVKVGGQYFLILIYLLSCVFSLVVSVHKNLPNQSVLVAIGRMMVVFIPFHAFIPLYIYNYNKKEVIPKLTLIGLSILLFINVLGFLGGLKNAIHSIEGRVSFPFIDSFYDGAGILAVINLMLIFYMKKTGIGIMRFTGLIIYFLLNLLLLFFINSRLHLLIFLVTAGLTIFSVGLKPTLVFVISLFTLPILLNGGVVIYQVLSLPIFETILQRVDMTDIMTFNGRSFLWQNTVDWLFYDQRGVLFGNGYKGHYFLKLNVIEALRWGTRPYYLHLHSSSLEVLISQGLFGAGLLLTILYKLFVFLRKNYLEKNETGMFFPVLVFLLFILHVDTFAYLTSIGSTLLLLFAAMMVVKEKKPVPTTDWLNAFGEPPSINGSDNKTLVLK